MSETRHDKLADEFDAMRLDVSTVATVCDSLASLQGISPGERAQWEETAKRLRTILSKYPQKNFPKGAP